MEDDGRVKGKNADVLSTVLDIVQEAGQWAVIRTTYSTRIGL